MNGWAGFWIGLALLLFGMAGWTRYDCAHGVSRACERVAAKYADKPKTAGRIVP